MTRWLSFFRWGTKAASGRTGVRRKTRSGSRSCSRPGAEPDWPDVLDVYTGSFTYYGDNRSPGRELHDTPRRGNLLLRRVFEWAHDGASGRARVPPFFLFDKPGRGRDVRFRGLLAPGSSRLSGEEDLVAVWRTTAGQRFQNYRARFTVLDAEAAPQTWIGRSSPVTH